MSNYVIIVAGGKGLRMGSEIPKQFLPVKGKPVLMRTLERFKEYDEEAKLILVLPLAQQDYWRQLCQEHHFSVEHTLAQGGSTRFESSKNGLQLIPAEAQGLVAIHDGVRPFVSIDTIGRCFEAAQRDSAAIPVMPVTDTLRLIEPDGESHNVLRSSYRSVQTPQVFSIDVAREAFNQPYQECFTDDASVVEHIGHKVTMVDGNRENIKITTPADLLVADALA